MLAVILSCSLTLAPAPQEPATRQLQDLSTPELVRRLPRIHSEREWSGAQRKSLAKPVVTELRRRLDAGATLEDREWITALRQSGALNVRDRWPRDVPFAVSLEIPGWLPSLRMHVTESTLLTGEATVTPGGHCFNGVAWMRERAYHQVLGELTLGTHELIFSVELAYRDADRNHRTWSGTIAHRVQVVEDVADVLPAVQSEALSRAIASSLYRMETNLVLEPAVGEFPELAVTGLSLDVALLRDGTEVESIRLRSSRHDLWALLNRRGKATPGFYDSGTIAALPTAAGPEWSLRVTGTRADAMRLWEAEQLWIGELELPLAAIRERR